MKHKIILGLLMCISCCNLYAQTSIFEEWKDMGIKKGMENSYQIKTNNSFIKVDNVKNVIEKNRAHTHCYIPGKDPYFELKDYDVQGISGVVKKIPSLQI